MWYRLVWSLIRWWVGVVGAVGVGGLTFELV